MKPNNIEKKKILWVHSSPPGDGVGGGWMYTQYKSIKHEVDLYHVNKLTNPLVFVHHLVRLRKMAKEYEIVHAQYGSAVGFLTSFMNSTRILSLKGSDWYSSPPHSLLDRIRIYLGIRMTKNSINRFHHIIVMSNLMKNDVLQHFPDVKVTTLVDPIDLDKFSPSKRHSDNNIKKVLFAAVHLENPVKRFSLAKKSFEILQQKMPDTELVKMSKIPHSEVCGFMNKMDVLLLTSTHEGWPNVVKEMMACNKPFVSTKVSDLEELAKKTKSCFTCNANPEEIANALFKSLHSPKEDLRKLVSGFDIHRNISALKEIYQNYL